MAWQLQDAKQRFSELVRRAIQEGPQVVTRHGEEVAVLVSLETYRKLSGQTPDFKSFLLGAPDFSHLELERDSAATRIVELPERGEP
jgi:prevent-host-death family protein